AHSRILSAYNCNRHDEDPMTSHGKLGASSEISEQEIREFSLLTGGYACFQALSTACRLDLFTYLSKNPDRKLPEIVESVGITEHAAKTLLATCEAMNLVRTKDGERYRNAPVAEKYLVKTSSENIFPLLEAHRAIIYPAMASLFDSAKQGKAVGLD